MSKREIREVLVRGKVLDQLQNITVSNATFSGQFSKYLTTWISIELENYQKLHGPVLKAETYQTYADTQAPAKGGRKITQTKKDKDSGIEKQVEVSPKAFFTNLGNLKIFLNYFLLKYAMELRHIFIANGHEFDRNYNEEELEKDAFEIILNPLIPFVLHVAKKFDASKYNYTVQFDGMTQVKQIFKSQENGQASTKKIEQFMNKFLDFVNVFILQIFTISFPHKSLLHLDYVIGLLDVFNGNVDEIAVLGEDVIQDLHYYLEKSIKKPVKGTGKKGGAATKKGKDKKDVEEDPEDAEDPDDDIPTEADEADYGDI